MNKAMFGFSVGQCMIGDSKVYLSSNKSPAMKVYVLGSDVRSANAGWATRSSFWVRGQENIDRFQKKFPKGTVIEGSWAPVKADYKREDGTWANALELVLDTSTPFVAVPQSPVTASVTADQVPF